MAFEFKRLEIPEVILITPKVFEDERGFFLETYKESEFKKNGILELFVQDNHSKSSKGVLRGLHFQKKPNSQGKLVRCTNGEILDVIVDIRKKSKSYKKFLKIKLSSENKHMVYIPSGFAHGFLTLSKTAEIQYKCTKEYSSEDSRVIIWNDKSIGIDWEIDNPILSENDLNGSTLENI